VHVVMFDPGNYTPHYVENLSRALVQSDVSVSLITSPGLFEESWKGLPFAVENLFFQAIGGSAKGFYQRHLILRRARKILSYPAGLWRSWRVLKDRSPGILHVQWALLPFLDAVLIRKLRSRGWRIVYTAHDVDFELSGPIHRWSYRSIYREADAVIVHSTTLRQQLCQANGDVLREVRAIPEGIATFPFSPELDRTTARSRLGLHSHGPVLLFFGYIKPYKGLEYLLQAWARVIRSYPDARLVIAGEGLCSMRPVYHLVDSLNLRGSLVLQIGYIPRSDAQYCFCAADAVVLPYTRIATSSVVPLAYQFARPVIATSVGGLPEIVRDNQTGFLVPPRAEEALADAICRAFCDRERLASMGAYARRWFETERRWDQVARQTTDLYTSLLRENPLDWPQS